MLFSSRQLSTRFSSSKHSGRFLGEGSFRSSYSRDNSDQSYNFHQFSKLHPTVFPTLLDFQAVLIFFLVSSIPSLRHQQVSQRRPIAPRNAGDGRSPAAGTVGLRRPATTAMAVPWCGRAATQRRFPGGAVGAVETKHADAGGSCELQSRIRKLLIAALNSF